MFRWLNLISIFLSILLMGCSPSSTAEPSINTSNPQTTAPVNPGQYLPITAQATVPNGTNIDLEVARTPQQQAMGLMYRPALPDNRGMLFEFPTLQTANFWMKNVPVPLDMVFLQNGTVKYIVTAPPCSSEPCPTYGPSVPIDQVIELRAGRANELGLRVGDSVKINFLKSNASP